MSHLYLVSNCIGCANTAMTASRLCFTTCFTVFPTLSRNQKETQGDVIMMSHVFHNETAS
ncbi:hypothetical protein Q31b_08470 [Novipirellula aureliae]|uniref:Uncharacterized protein n=1 Tax=Novipirellula aureliae TaxID=2527966 RepID=A0A5C6ED90_9BACT|nr:hypothetical protein Q31b_08470 [Novipirellula aureliae]